MLTKREACLAVIGDFCAENKVGPEELTDNHMLLSSKLAVAMEYLDLIEEEGMKELAMTRGGMILFHFTENDAKTLTFRELLDLLPEDKKKGKIKWKDLK
jgi:hypothetical protein